MTNPILISSNLIVDDVWLADGRPGGTHPGGAALWAAIGARTAWSHVAVAAGVGDDFEAEFGQTFDRIGLTRDALVRRDANSIRSRLVYSAEDERTETPAYGADHFDRMQVGPADLPAKVLPAAGTYIFRDLWPAFWDGVRAKRADLGTVVWELQGDVAGTEHWPQIAGLLPLVDGFSLNRAEALALTGAGTLPGAAQVIIAAGAPLVALRDGARGAMIATQDLAFRVTPARGPVRDVTGGGNAFTGGLLAGLVRHQGDLIAAARQAAAAAATVLAQFGPPDTLDPLAIADLAASASIIPETRPVREKAKA